MIASNPFEELSAQLSQVLEKLDKLPASAPAAEIIDRIELRRRLGLSEPAVIRWGRRGTIPEIRIGSQVRYNWPAVVAALEAGEKPKPKKR